MKKCFVVTQRTNPTTGYVNAPVSVHLDQECAQREVDLFNSEEPLQAWVEEVPFHPEFNVKGTETGRTNDA